MEILKSKVEQMELAMQKVIDDMLADGMEDAEVMAVIRSAGKYATKMEDQCINEIFEMDGAAGAVAMQVEATQMLTDMDK